MNQTPTPTTVLVLASTFPSSPADPVPAFVRDQVVALAHEYPELRMHVLAPHDERSHTVDRSEHEGYTEHRFHYVWPRKWERLAGRGIMPALRENKLLYATVPLLILGELFATKRLVRELKPSIIYAHWFTPQAIVAAIVGASARVPFVFTTHASDVDVWRKVPVVGGRIVRWASRKAVAITAVSSRSRRKLERFFDESKHSVEVDIVAMGVPLEVEEGLDAARSASRATLGLGSEPVVFFIGRLVEKKGVEYLIEALATPGALGGNYTAIIAGDGPLRSKLEARVADAGLSERVRFIGFVSGEEKRDWLRAADIMVVPSVISADGDAEGLPVSLLEGLAAGLTCIATNESGADDILTDGVNGYLCGERDSAALLRLLTTATEHSPEQRAAFTARARELATEFSWPTIARKHYEVLFVPALRQGARS